MSANIQVRSWFEELPLRQLGPAIADKAEELKRFCDAVPQKGGWDPDKVLILNTRNDEIEAATKRLEQLQQVDRIYTSLTDRKNSMNEPAPHVPFGSANGDAPGMQGLATKSFGEYFVESSAYKGIGEHNDMTTYSVRRDEFMVDFRNPAYKTTMTTGAGYAPPNPRTDIVVPYAQRQPMLADVVPIDPTTLSSVKYMEETTALSGTNAQVAVSENAAKFENTLAFTERTVTVETVATYLPVTNQQLDDVPNIRGIIDNRLMTFLQLKEEDLLLNGTGTTPQITGFLVKSGTNTQARGTDTNIDCIFKGMQACRTVGFAEPDAIIMHPDNWTPIRLYKDSNGNYSFDVTADGAVTRLFGKVLIVTPAMTSGTALVGSFRLYSHISRRMGMTTIVGRINDDLVKNKQTILAEYRESLEIYRPAAFTKCTGLQ